MDKIAIDKARSLYYGLFSKLFVFTEDKTRYAGVTEALKVIIASPINDDMKESASKLLEFFEKSGEEALIEEYDDIFFDPSSDIVRTTASFYDEEVESGIKRVEVKNFLGKTKIRRDEKHFTEAEDSVEFLMTFMHELIELSIAGHEQYGPIEYSLFKEIINNFIDEFCKELYIHPKSVAYKEVANMLNVFMEFERVYLDVEKVKPKKRKKRGFDVDYLGEEAKAQKERQARKKSKPIDFSKLDDDIQDVETDIQFDK